LASKPHVARSAGAAAVALGLCTASWAHASDEVRVARPVPFTSDVKTAAPATVKSPLAARNAPQSSIDAASSENGGAKSASVASTRSQPARIDHSKMIYSRESDGTLGARGATYKAEFGAGRATYVPLFGARAPANHPVAFALESAAIGGRALELDRGASATRSGDSVRFERGALTEIYELSPSAIEQKFVLESLPANTSASASANDSLVLTIAIDSDLSRSTTDAGLELSNELGAVLYGRAEIVDAQGRRAPASTEWNEGSIQIAVTESFLAQASFPVTIDPLITTLVVDNSPDDDFAPDVAFDAITGDWISVYEEAVSAADHDVVAIIADSNGLVIPGGLYYIDNSAENWTKPRVANNNLAHQFMIVAEVGSPGAHSIRARTIHSDGLGLSNKLVIADVAGMDLMNPDVGGDTSVASPSYYCVVWERVYSSTDHDIHAAVVTSAGVVSPTIYVENSSGTLDTNPSISKSDGLPPFVSQEWNVVWQRLFIAGDHDVFGAQIHWDGGVTTPTFGIFTSGADETAPRASSLLDGGSSARPYLVVCQQETPALDHDILGAIVVGFTSLDTKDLTLLDGPGAAGKDQTNPVVDSDGHQFVVAYAEQYATGSNDYDPYVSTFNSAGNSIGVSEARIQLSNSSAHEDELAIAAMHSGGLAASTFMVAWHSAGATGGDIFGALYQSFAGGPKTPFCFGTNAQCPCNNGGLPGNGCANSQNASGAHLDAVGTAQVSADTLVLQASGMPSPSTCLYFQGTASNPHMLGDGSMCAGGALVRLGAKANVNGASSFGGGNDPHLSVKGNVPAAGGTRYYQVWYRDNHAFCNAETYNFSNGIAAVWVP
jgi:hypothetical protein